MVVVGAIAGRGDRHTRELAERLAADGDAPSAELARRLRDPLNLALNASMLVAIVARRRVDGLEAGAASTGLSARRHAGRIHVALSANPRRGRLTAALPFGGPLSPQRHAAGDPRSAVGHRRCLSPWRCLHRA